MFFSRYTGKEINELEHIFQSIEMILHTRIGSRVMRRDFGSRLLDLIDQPMNQSTITAIYAAVNEAISAWEPRVRVVQTQIDTEEAKEGIVNLRIAVQSDVGIIENIVTITSESVGETPLDPSVPVIPTERDYNSFVFDNGKRFVFDNGKEFIWRSR